MKLDQEQKQMILALFLVAAICALILGSTDQLTRAPIAQAQHEAFMKGLMQVLPEHNNDPSTDSVSIERTTYYLARNNQNRILGIAWETTAPDGYSGTIRILVGVRPGGEVFAVRITEHKETPGLGDGIVNNQAWLDSFIGKTLANARWHVRKDGGDFDQFTGATISPRAVVKAVKRALGQFEQQRSRILAPAVKAPQGSAS